jgi:hypothetical protein
MFDLDELSPLARQIARSATPGSGDPKQQLTFNAGIQPGNPFFNAETIHLADNEQQVLNIRMQVTHYYATFDLEIDYITGIDVAIHKAIVSDYADPPIMPTGTSGLVDRKASMSNRVGIISGCSG